MAAKELSQKEMKEIKGGLKVDESMVAVNEAPTIKDATLEKETILPLKK